MADEKVISTVAKLVKKADQKIHLTEFVGTADLDDMEFGISRAGLLYFVEIDGGDRVEIPVKLLLEQAALMLVDNTTEKEAG